MLRPAAVPVPAACFEIKRPPIVLGKPLGAFHTDALTCEFQSAGASLKGESAKLTDASTALLSTTSDSRRS